MAAEPLARTGLLTGPQGARAPSQGPTARMGEPAGEPSCGHREVRASRGGRGRPLAGAGLQGCPVPSREWGHYPEGYGQPLKAWVGG